MKPESATTTSDQSDTQQQVSQFPYWYHRIELPGGITTPGFAPINPQSYSIPEDLAGKRVLDIGAWDGYWSFQAVKRGAKEVVAIDDFSDYLGSLEKSDRKAWATFDFCKAKLGISDQVCSRREMSVYDISEEELGRFDVVFFFGTLYHLRYPLLALDKISAICDASIHIESAILDDFSPYQGGLGQGYNDKHIVAEFYPTNEYGNNHTNWWTPTLRCLGALVQAAGFDDIKGWKLTSDAPTQLSHCRGFVRGIKNNLQIDL